MKFICGRWEESREFLRIISHFSPYLDVLGVGVRGSQLKGEEREYEEFEQFFSCLSALRTLLILIHSKII